MDIQGLIVGLGNPGPKYAITRHNIGFLTVDAVLADIAGKSYRRSVELQVGDLCRLWAVSLPRVKGDFLLCTPLTYMNLSGRAVNHVRIRYGVRPADIVVIHDEMDLPLGRIKLKQGGGAAGHNGILSIAEELGTEAFGRMRLGIGRPEGFRDVKDYVLEPFTPAEAEILPLVLGKARDTLPLIFGRGWASAMQAVHPWSALPPPTSIPADETPD